MQPHTIEHQLDALRVAIERGDRTIGGEPIARFASDLVRAAASSPYQDPIREMTRHLIVTELKSLTEGLKPFTNGRLFDQQVDEVVTTVNFWLEELKVLGIDPKILEDIWPDACVVRYYTAFVTAMAEGRTRVNGCLTAEVGFDLVEAMEASETRPEIYGPTLRAARLAAQTHINWMIDQFERLTLDEQRVNKDAFSPELERWLVKAKRIGSPRMFFVNVAMRKFNLELDPVPAN